MGDLPLQTLQITEYRVNGHIWPISVLNHVILGSQKGPPRRTCFEEALDMAILAYCLCSTPEGYRRTSILGPKGVQNGDGPVTIPFQNPPKYGIFMAYLWVSRS